MKNVIQQALNRVFEKITRDKESFDLQTYKKIKAQKSAKGIASILNINESMLNEFETAVNDYYKFVDDSQKSKIVSFRLVLWLETICKNLNITFNIEEAISNEELAVKQVRALELIIRDVVNDNLGGKDNVLLKLQQLFKQEAVEKWLKNGDETGVLSGTTFSELSNIFLDKNIFKGLQEIFDSEGINLSGDSRDFLRKILEDIRLIRNAIAHNKRVSKIQVEALNEYYRTIANLIKDSKTNSINPDSYLDLDKANIESFLSSLKEDNKTVSIGLEELKNNVNEVKSDTSTIRKRSSFVLIGIFLLLISSCLIIYFVSKQSGTSDEMRKDIKDVKEIVKGDAELKNMSTSDDLTVTKELNERTKDKNAKRIAIIYFDNSGGDPAMNVLKKGLADMMITDLSNIRMLNIVERDKLEAILKEQKLNNSKEFDAGTASKVGKLLGAQIILTGSYFDLFGSIRVDARFIDVETGQILKSDGVEGQTTSFFKLQKQLSWKILKNLDTKITDDEKKEIEKNDKSKALTFSDLNEYSKALDLYDNGKKKEALVIASKIEQKYPEFLPVRNLIKKLKS
jgi:TolB-like protein